MKALLTKDPTIAGDIIRQGGVGIFPTETVYGIGASSFIEEACLKIYQIKNRPIDNPFIVHVSDISEIKKYGEISFFHLEKISYFVPGPITFIVLKKEKKIFSTGLPTIGLRIPKTPIIQKMLVSSGPVSAPSANLSGKPSLTRLEDVIKQFGDIVDVILEAEEPEIGIESTVVDLSGENPILLRPGKISLVDLKKVFNDIIFYKEKNTQKPISPGLKYRHYAPNCKLFLVDSPTPQTNPSAWIGFEKPNQIEYSVVVRDNEEYMKELYKFFIECDKKNIQTAYCQMPKEDENKMALLNRLEKAMEKEN